MPLDQDGAVREADLVAALADRVRAIEDLVRTTNQVVDEKALKELRRTLEALSKRDPKFEERVTNKVDVLADRIETVAKTVSTASASVAAKEGEIAQLRRELEAGLARVNTAVLEARRGTDPAELVEIRRTLDDLSKVSKQRMPRGLEGRVDELTAKFELVSQRVDYVSSTVSTTASGLAGRDGDVNALRRAFEAEGDRVGAELAELRRGIDPAAMADLRQALKELADDTARRQHASHNLIGQAGAKIDALAGTVDSLATALESTAKRVSGTEDGLSAFRAYFDDARGRLNALLTEHRQTLATLAARASALEQSNAAGSETTTLLDDRISAASERIEELAERLEPLSSAVASAHERIEARDEAIHAMEERFRDASARVDGLVAELSRALAEFPDPEGIEQALAARIDEVAARGASLADDLARVETSVLEQVRTSASSADVERLRDELSGVRARIDEAGGRLGSLVAHQEQLLTELDVRTAALEQADGKALQELHERVTDLGGTLDDLAHQVEASASTITSTAAGISRTDEEASALREYVEKAGERLSSLLAEQTRSLAALGQRTSSLEQAERDAMTVVDERLSETTDRIDELSSRLDPLVAQAREELAGRIEELAARLGAADEDRATNAGEIARVAAILEVERASLRAKLDVATAALEKTVGALDADQLERRVAGIAARVEALDRERASSHAQFEAIANALASIPPHSSIEERLDKLSRRLAEVEQRGAAVASKVSQASALLPTALRSLEARLDEVAPGSRTAVREPQPDVPADQPPPLVDEPETAEPAETLDRATAAVVPLRAIDP